MDFFKSGLKSVLGTPQEGYTPSGAETVERLIDRLQNSTLLADRRDACRALNALSKKYRVEVGAHGLPSLKAVLLSDRNDSELVGYALNTLTKIVSPELHEDETSENPTNIGEQFTEIFIKEADSVPLVLSFLEEFDFKVLWPTVKLLHALLTHKLKEIQEVILASPMAVSKLMDLLSDSREIIRNDALLLLIQLTKGNANLQKIVAFENAFDRLFDVINDEGNVDGGIVVEDCLLLMLNLLRGNYSNINFFKEGYYIRHLHPMFQLALENQENNWPSQKITNYHCMLEILRTLVTPGSPAKMVQELQHATAKCGLLQVLCDILTANGVPEDILSETINCLAEVIRGNSSNQNYLHKALAPSVPPRPLIMVLMMTLVNEKQPFTLRTSVLYCYECFLYQNQEFQAQLIETLLPKDSETEGGELSVGQLICGALFSYDPLSNWLACVALSYGLVENPAQQENMLRVQLTTLRVEYAAVYSDKPFTLLQHCCLLLQSVTHIQAKIGFLILLSTWLCHCSAAVKIFLAIPNSISYLISKIQDDNDELQQGLCAFLMAICVVYNDNSVENFTRAHLTQIIYKRIGLETFQNRLGLVSKHEIYCKAVKHPRMNIVRQNELLLDYEFCKLFKAMEGLLVNSIHPTKNQQEEAPEQEINASNQYKTVIRNLDEELLKSKHYQEFLEKKNTMFNDKIKELEETVEKLKLERQEYQSQIKNQITPEMYNILLENYNQLNINYKEILVKMQEKDEYIAQLESKLKENGNNDLNVLENDKSNSKMNELNNIENSLHQTDSISKELEKLQNDNEDLLVLLSNYDIKINKMKQEFLKVGIEVVEEDSDVIFQKHF